jgi:hypothetical protein
MMILGITCHWIDENFHLHEALLSFKKLNGRHTGERLSQEVLDILIEFDLTQKLFCITSDNAGNMGKLMKCLSRRLKSHGVKWKASENHISCLNHVLNLAVQAFLKKIKALAPQEVEAIDLKDKDDNDNDDSNDSDNEIELSISGDEEEEDNDEEDIFCGPALLEETDNNTIEDGLQGTMKKLRSTANVHIVAHKMTISGLQEPFCVLHIL